MKLKNMVKCDKCKSIYSTSPWVNMCADGELAYSRIELYGDKYDLCPKCTKEVYDLITDKKVN